MAGDDDYVFDEESGEWLPAARTRGEAGKARPPGAVEVRDAVGNLLADGDQVTLIKDLEVKGAGQTLKRGTADPLDPPDRRRAGDRLQVHGDQGTGAAGGVCAEAVRPGLRRRGPPCSPPLSASRSSSPPTAGRPGRPHRRRPAGRRCRPG